MVATGDDPAFKPNDGNTALSLEEHFTEISPIITANGRNAQCQQ